MIMKIGANSTTPSTPPIASSTRCPMRSVQCTRWLIARGATAGESTALIYAGRLTSRSGIPRKYPDARSGQGHPHRPAALDPEGFHIARRKVGDHELRGDAVDANAE